jgi:hypothetical protein
MDKPDKLTEMAISIGANVLCAELIKHKKHPVDDWCYELDIEKLFRENIDDHEEVNLVTENPSYFVKMINNTIGQKLNYLYSEGFLRKEDDFYYVLSKEEIEAQVNEYTKTND